MKKKFFAILFFICIFSIILSVFLLLLETNYNPTYEKITNIGLINDSGNIKTYEVEYSSNKKYNFVVNTSKYEINGLKANNGHTPIISISSNGNWIIDGENSRVKADIDKTKFNIYWENNQKKQNGGNSFSINRGTEENPEYIEISSIEDLMELINDESNSSITVPVIFIGADGKLIVNGNKTSIDSNSCSIFENSPIYVVFIEKIDSDIDYDTYAIVYNDKENDTFKINKNTLEIESNDIDIKLDENGNWIYNGIDTNIDFNESNYDAYLNSHLDYFKSKEEWLMDLKDNVINGKTLEKVKCIFNPNNESFPYELDLVKGSKLVLPNIPKNIGYEFLGWFDSDNNLYDENYYVLDNLNLYAHYNIKTYKIILKSNGSDNLILNTKYNEDVLLPKLTKDGCLFLGWYDGNEIVKSGKYTIDGDSCYVAKWIPVYEKCILANSQGELLINGDDGYELIVCNIHSLAIKDSCMSGDWYCDDILVFFQIDQVYPEIIPFIENMNRASSEYEQSKGDTFTLKLDFVWETKSKLTDLFKATGPRYHVRS